MKGVKSLELFFMASNHKKRGIWTDVCRHFIATVWLCQRYALLPWQEEVAQPPLVHDVKWFKKKKKKARNLSHEWEHIMFHSDVGSVVLFWKGDFLLGWKEVVGSPSVSVFQVSLWTLGANAASTSAGSTFGFGRIAFLFCRSSWLTAKWVRHFYSAFQKNVLVFLLLIFPNFIMRCFLFFYLLSFFQLCFFGIEMMNVIIDL